MQIPIASYLQVFADLPDLQHPSPTSNTSDGENIGIIPIFSDVFLDRENCIAFAKSACYSRQTAALETGGVWGHGSSRWDAGRFG
ncbi:hypothetical protein F4X90_17745 [Candidatus Poribacteria bacterium]|nr:hypothetical protein [Candidatus Poribacteria bacterium]